MPSGPAWQCQSPEKNSPEDDFPSQDGDFSASHVKSLFRINLAWVIFWVVRLFSKFILLPSMEMIYPYQKNSSSCRWLEPYIFSVHPTHVGCEYMQQESAPVAKYDVHNKVAIIWDPGSYKSLPFCKQTGLFFKSTIDDFPIETSIFIAFYLAIL